MKKDKSKKLKDQSRVDSSAAPQNDTSTCHPERSEGSTECEKCAEYLAGWKRALADYENMKADIDKVRSHNRDQIKIDLALSLLPVMDNFDQAVSHAPEASDAIETWLQGVKFIKKQFEDVFEEMGLEMIDTSIEFDHNLHEAVEEREEKGSDPGRIIEVQQTGWKIGYRILRPAKVIINKLK